MRCFHDAFGSAFRSPQVDESVLDFPSGNTLSKDVWERRKGKYVLGDEAERKARRIFDWAVKELSLKNPSARIVGSICSNTFNPKSDIDIHISADNITKGNADDVNRKLTSAFKRKFSGKSEGSVGGHPLEVYAQHNINQDIMSVGCYDLLDGKWMSGPEILDTDFNPYEEYYDGIQKHLDGLSDDIRKHVLLCGELATVAQKVLGKSPNDAFAKRIGRELKEATSKARLLFEDIRKKRSVASAPNSESDAKKKRVSREWKVADSSFKYLDKLGYIATLLSIAKAGEDDGLDTLGVAGKVIEEIHANLFNNDRTGYADVNRD